MKHLAVLIVLAGICFGTVSTTTVKTSPTVGNGSTVAFVFSFSYTATSEIVVTSRVTATGLDTVQTETTHYSVSAASDTGGTVTFVTAPASTVTITISRTTPQTQSNDIDAGSSVSLTSLEVSHDKAMRLIQELQEENDRTPKFPITDTAATTGDYPSTVTRAGKSAVYDSEGNPAVTGDAPPGLSEFSFINDSTNYADLDTAIADIGSTKTTLYVTGNTTVTANLSVPSTLTLRFHRQGALVIGAGITATINSPIEAGRHQIFTGAGTAAFGAGTVDAIKPEWFGFLPEINTDAQAILNLDAFKKIVVAASAAKIPIEFGTGTYYPEYGTGRIITLLDDLAMIGQGKHVTTIKWREVGGAGSTNGLMRDDGNGIDNLLFKDIAFDNTDVTPGASWVIGTVIWVGVTGSGDAVESDNITIDNCKFISRSRSMLITKTDNVLITETDCVVASAVTGIPGIVVMNGSTNVRIIGNRVEDQTADAAVACINVQASNMLISDNVVGSSIDSTAILVEGEDNILITSNIIDLSNATNVNCNGIIIDGCDVVKIVGNLIIGHASPTGPDGIGIGIGSRRNNTELTIENNQIINFWTSIRIGNSTAVTFGDHYVSHNVLVDAGENAFLLDVDGSVTYTNAESSFLNNEVRGTNNRAHFNMPTDAGDLVIDGNVGFQIRLNTLSSDHSTIIGTNTGGAPTYRETVLDALATAQYDMIDWQGNVLYIPTTAMDLSGGAESIELFGYDFDKAYYIANIIMYYSEASSADAGVALSPFLFDTASGSVRAFTVYTSEINKAVRTRIKHRVVNNNNYTTPAFFVFTNAGGKTGTGEVVATLKLIEQ